MVLFYINTLKNCTKLSWFKKKLFFRERYEIGEKKESNKGTLLFFSLKMIKVRKT